MLPDPVGAHHDDEQAPLATFLNALPAHVPLRGEQRVITAVATLASAGVDLAQVAHTCGRGTERRSRDDRRKLALHRLTRAAEQVGGAR